MPRYKDLQKVLVIGSGPIVIGQACEFDYSGTQACKALMSEGLEVVLVNSNPATIMTDPEIATRVYIEPLTVESVKKIIHREKPDAIIPTLGGQTALNLALALNADGILEKEKIRLLGADPKVIEAAEDREKFRDLLDRVHAKYPKSEMVRTLEQGLQAANKFGFPLILRPNYTLGGGGGGVAYTAEDYHRMLALALHESPTSEVLIEESILGWKEFELEVMRDRAGTFVVVCSIENFDPCGVHTGDSITFAPQQTLSDEAYQAMRDEASKILNAVGVETGGANIQFAVHPETNERLVIEMNPRVSRSSALASKATGFPIAKIAALLAIGYELSEIKNDITQKTPSCYEPALDYVVTKIPRFNFEKFSGSKDLLTTQMKSVGEVMAIGRTLQESLMKALVSLEYSAAGIPEILLDEQKIATANSQRIFHLFQALRQGMTVDDLVFRTGIRPYFLEQMEELVAFEKEIQREKLGAILHDAKRLGFSDARIGELRGVSAEAILHERLKLGLRPTFQQVDTCAGEFASVTPYFYSTYWCSDSAEFENKKPIAVIGSGPNRIGQGIEFDYSCVRGVQALQRFGEQVAMINSNPETVSTDYDTADILFFEPLTLENVREVLFFLKPKGFVAQLGGQTPINLCPGLIQSGFRLLGSSLESIDQSEDRGLFGKLCQNLGLRMPSSAMVTSAVVALERVRDIGFPVICRPSYVLGGRRMEVIENNDELQKYFTKNADVIDANHPCLMDEFLEGALEVDVDLVRGSDWTLIGGILEHIEAAGVHSGDSMGVVPPQRLKPATAKKVLEQSMAIAERMNVIGHLNLQLAIQDDEIFVLEANPRSSRSVPFLAKATMIPIVDLGIAAMLGQTAKQVDPSRYDWTQTKMIHVKGVVFPFKKFPEADSILGPEMKSTGESMGRATSYPEALMKALISSHVKLPLKGEVFFSLRDKDKAPMLELAKELRALGFALSATTGTAQFFSERGAETLALRKVHEGRPHCVDRIRSGDIAIVFNTTRGRTSIEASFDIRRACIEYGIPCVTESDAAFAFVLALRKALVGDYQVEPLVVH